MEQKGLKGGTKSYGCATGGGGSDASPWLRTCFYSEMFLGKNPRPPPPPPPPPPPRWRPEGLHRPLPRISAPLWRPFSPGTKIDKKKKRERGALDTAAFKLAPIYKLGGAPPPRLAPMPPPLHPPPPPPPPWYATAPPNGWSSAYLSFLINSLIALNVKQ